MKNIKGRMLTVFIAGLVCSSAMGAQQSLGDISSQIYGNFANLSKLITAGSYIAGLGFALASIMKFKMHKDNPTQVPIGTPAALVFIAAAMLFLPSILETAGLTIFNDGGTVATSTGTAWVPSFDGSTSSSTPRPRPRPRPRPSGASISPKQAASIKAGARKSSVAPAVQKPRIPPRRP